MAAATESNVREVKGILQKLEDNLSVACDQLSAETPSPENESFNKDAFWNDFVGATKILSHEATKFCMMFSKQPLPSAEECQLLANNLERTCLSLVTIFFALPKSNGRTLHKDVRLYVLYVLIAIKDLCIAAKNQSPNQLQTVGVVWEKCEAAVNLPKDNKDAVIELCREEHDLVEDASQELMEVIDQYNEGEDNNLEDESEFSFVTPRNGIRIPLVRSWTETDRHVVLPCSGLVKASKACLKKILKALSEREIGGDEPSITELDELAEIIKSTSSLVDDFVLALCPPVNHTAVRHQASLVRNNAKDLLLAVSRSHFCSESDMMWIEFLEKAVDHNWVKINDTVLTD